MKWPALLVQTGSLGYFLSDVNMLFLCHVKVKIWFQNRRMKWRNSKERELLTTGGCRQQTLPTKTNPHPDLTDVGSTYCHRLSRTAAYCQESHLCHHHFNHSALSESGKQSDLSVIQWKQVSSEIQIDGVFLENDGSKSRSA